MCYPVCGMMHIKEPLLLVLNLPKKPFSGYNIRPSPFNLNVSVKIRVRLQIMVPIRVSDRSRFRVIELRIVGNLKSNPLILTLKLRSGGGVGDILP